MRTFARRVVALGTLVMLYEINPTLGVAALSACFGYFVARELELRRRRASLVGAPQKATFVGAPQK